MHSPVLVTPPDMLTVSLAEAKAHLRVDHDDDDTLIASLIRAAVDHLDGWTGILGRCLVEQTWRQDFDHFRPCLRLPLGPVISISSVTVGGDTLDPSSYAIRTDAGGRARVEFDGVTARGSASVVYKAGYPTIPEVPADGDTPAIPAKSTVPPALKVAIMLLVGTWYANRETMVVGATVESLPFAVDALIAPYRRVGV